VSVTDTNTFPFPLDAPRRFRRKRPPAAAAQAAARRTSRRGFAGTGVAAAPRGAAVHRLRRRLLQGVLPHRSPRGDAQGHATLSFCVSCFLQEDNWDDDPADVSTGLGFCFVFQVRQLWIGFRGWLLLN
jgi:hypothetical protein